jgi:mevalonate kinase
MQRVKTSAPGKLMLFGEHSVVFGHPCIVTAVDLRLSVTVEENSEHFFSLEAPDLGLQDYHRSRQELGQGNLPKAASFLETCYSFFLERYPQELGVKVLSKNEFTSSYGLGSSSASTVALAKALSEFYELNLSNEELFELSYQTVLRVQGVASGFDLAAAIWGGTLYYVMPHTASAAPIVQSIVVPDLPLLVGYTGIKADTATLIRQVQALRQANPQQVDDIFGQITALVEQAKLALAASDFAKFGKLMTKNQVLLRQLQVSSSELENLIKASLAAGAFGAKLSGAGGGDCMLAVVAQTQRAAAAQAIDRAGGKIIEVKTNAEGVRIEDKHQ